MFKLVDCFPVVAGFVEDHSEVEVGEAIVGFQAQRRWMRSIASCGWPDLFRMAPKLL